MTRKLSEAAWRPIETAPKDGTMFYMAAWDTRAKCWRTEPTFYDNDDLAFADNRRQLKGWRSNFFFIADRKPAKGNFAPRLVAVYWQPLPEPPQGDFE